MVTGNGCFKCGSTDHVAKDCVGGNQPSKFIVKDQNRQHGGGEGYDMVFEGDTPASPKREKRELSHDKEKIPRRSPHGYGEGKRQHRDDRDTEDKADDKYNGRRQHREEVRDRDRRYNDGLSREKKHRERDERDSREDEDRRRRRREEMRDRERRVESRRERDDHWSDKDYKERRRERVSGNGREARDERRDR